MIASEGPAVDPEIANAAKILDPSTLNPEAAASILLPNPSLAPGQGDPSDILLSKAFWPWDDLGAKGIPEHWLYMARRVEGVIAMLAVQTPAGPKLLQADKTGRLVPANYYDRNATTVQLHFENVDAPHGTATRATYQVPQGRKALIEMVAITAVRITAAAPVGEVQAFVEVITQPNPGYLLTDFIDNTIGAPHSFALGQSGFMSAGDVVILGDFDFGTGGSVLYVELARITEFDA